VLISQYFLQKLKSIRPLRLIFALHIVRGDLPIFILVIPNECTTKTLCSLIQEYTVHVYNIPRPFWQANNQSVSRNDDWRISCLLWRKAFTRPS